jgi:hypothetical protein
MPVSSSKFIPPSDVPDIFFSLCVCTSILLHFWTDCYYPFIVCTANISVCRYPLFKEIISGSFLKSSFRHLCSSVQLFTFRRKLIFSCLYYSLVLLRRVPTSTSLHKCGSRHDFVTLNSCAFSFYSWAFS